MCLVKEQYLAKRLGISRPFLLMAEKDIYQLGG